MTIAKDCMELIGKKLAKEITSEQYYCELIELDRKYPGVGFYQAAQEYARKSIKSTHKEKPTRDGKAAAAGDEQEVPF